MGGAPFRGRENEPCMLPLQVTLDQRAHLVRVECLRAFRCALATSTIAANNDLTDTSRVSSQCIFSTCSNNLRACVDRSSAGSAVWT